MKNSQLKDNLRGIYYIILKDIRSYYFKPPAISWGMVLPIAWILSFYLRSPRDFTELIPGLIAMTILFSTSAAESVVINFEIRIGSFERLLLAPISLPCVLLGKVLGGAIFGLIMTTLIAAGSIILFRLQAGIIPLFLIIIPSLLVFSALSALLCVGVKEVMDAQILLNLPRFLMVFLSGVVYPVSAMPKFLQYISYSLPLTYTINGLRGAFSPASAAGTIINAIILIFFFVLFLVPAMKLLEKKFE